MVIMIKRIYEPASSRYRYRVAAPPPDSLGPLDAGMTSSQNQSTYYTGDPPNPWFLLGQRLVLATRICASVRATRRTCAQVHRNRTKYRL